MIAPILAVPSLESGDRLTRAEFHERYCGRPDIKKAELVGGVVYLASPVRLSAHGEPHANILGWLAAYSAAHPDLRLGDNATVMLDASTEVQPDAFLMRESDPGPRVTADDYVEGAPQLVVEIAASSAAYDLHDKMDAYRRNGVQEYVVWRVRDGMISWFRLSGDAFVWVEPDERGVIESSAFAGLRLNVPRMLANDLAAVLAELRGSPR